VSRLYFFGEYFQSISFIKTEIASKWRHKNPLPAYPLFGHVSNLVGFTGMHLGQFDRLIPDFVRRIGHFPVEENVGLARLDFLGWYPSDILIVELVPLTPVQRVRNVMSSACRTVMTDDRKQLVRRHFRNTIGVEIGSHVEPLQRKTDRRRDLAAEHQLVPEPLQVDAEDFRELQDLHATNTTLTSVAFGWCRFVPY
jgi:hypothetical protein